MDDDLHHLRAGARRAEPHRAAEHAGGLHIHHARIRAGQRLPRHVHGCALRGSHHRGAARPPPPHEMSFPFPRRPVRRFFMPAAACRPAPAPEPGRDAASPARKKRDLRRDLFSCTDKLRKPEPAGEKGQRTERGEMSLPLWLPAEDVCFMSLLYAPRAAPSTALTKVLHAPVRPLTGRIDRIFPFPDTAAAAI